MQSKSDYMGQGALALDHGPSTFTFEACTVRIVLCDDEPWFVAADLCAALHLDSTAIRKLDADEKGLHSMQTLGGAQSVAIVSESGMYTLVLRCRDAVNPGTLPYRFRKWVTAEVLPAIRKTGRYDPHPVHADDEAVVVVWIKDGQVTRTQPAPKGSIISPPGHICELLARQGLVIAKVVNDFGVGGAA